MSRFRQTISGPSPSQSQETSEVTGVDDVELWTNFDEEIGFSLVDAYVAVNGSSSRDRRPLDVKKMLRGDPIATSFFSDGRDFKDAVAKPCIYLMNDVSTRMFAAGVSAKSEEVVLQSKRSRDDCSDSGYEDDTYEMVVAHSSSSKPIMVEVTHDRWMSKVAQHASELNTKLKNPLESLALRIALAQAGYLIASTGVKYGWISSETGTLFFKLKENVVTPYQEAKKVLLYSPLVKANPETATSQIGVDVSAYSQKECFFAITFQETRSAIGYGSNLMNDVARFGREANDKEPSRINLSNEPQPRTKYGSRNQMRISTSQEEPPRMNYNRTEPPRTNFHSQEQPQASCNRTELPQTNIHIQEHPRMNNSPPPQQNMMVKDEQKRMKFDRHESSQTKFHNHQELQHTATEPQLKRYVSLNKGEKPRMIFGAKSVKHPFSHKQEHTELTQRRQSPSQTSQDIRQAQEYLNHKEETLASFDNWEPTTPEFTEFAEFDYEEPRHESFDDREQQQRYNQAQEKRFDYYSNEDDAPFGLENWDKPQPQTHQRQESRTTLDHSRQPSSTSQRKEDVRTNYHEFRESRSAARPIEQRRAVTSPLEQPRQQVQPKADARAAFNDWNESWTKFNYHQQPQIDYNDEEQTREYFGERQQPRINFSDRKQTRDYFGDKGSLRTKWGPTPFSKPRTETITRNPAPPSPPPRSPTPEMEDDVEDDEIIDDILSKLQPSTPSSIVYLGAHIPYYDTKPLPDPYAQRPHRVRSEPMQSPHANTSFTALPVIPEPVDHHLTVHQTKPCCAARMTRQTLPAYPKGAPPPFKSQHQSPPTSPRRVTPPSPMLSMKEISQKPNKDIREMYGPYPEIKAVHEKSLANRKGWGQPKFEHIDEPLEEHDSSMMNHVVPVTSYHHQRQQQNHRHAKSLSPPPPPPPPVPFTPTVTILEEKSSFEFDDESVFEEENLSVRAAVRQKMKRLSNRKSLGAGAAKMFAFTGAF